MSWKASVNNVFPRHLNPGGWIELQDLVGYISCDDDTLSDEAPLKRWTDSLFQAFKNIDRPTDSVLRYEQQLADTGFIDVGSVKEKWPTNRWPKDKKYKQIGRLLPRPRTSN